MYKYFVNLFIISLSYYLYFFNKIKLFLNLKNKYFICSNYYNKFFYYGVEINLNYSFLFFFMQNFNLFKKFYYFNFFFFNYLIKLIFLLNMFLLNKCYILVIMKFVKKSKYKSKYLRYNFFLSSISFLNYSFYKKFNNYKFLVN